tara:strand:+ start:204 stop:932 length:729 start_codon:yes stop_codon:yes gene_type:complete
MKHIIERVIKSLKNVKGSSLAEFATTTALMATLAATAAPKLSELSEGTKAEKSLNELDKLKTLAGNFYQDTADTEGRGRFPGQARYDYAVGGDHHDTRSDIHDPSKHNEERDDIEEDLFGDYDETTDTWDGGSFNDFEDHDASQVWVSVFGLSSDAKRPDNISVIDTDPANSGADVYDYVGGSAEWLYLTNDEVLDSPFQDGHFIYRVVPGYKLEGGSNIVPPMIFLADLENPANLNTSLAP